MMELISALFAGIGMVLMLRYSFGKEINNKLLPTVFLIVISFLAALNYLAEPFTLPFQAGLSGIFIIISIILIIMMPPQKIDPEKEKDPVKATAKDNRDMAKAGIFFLLMMVIAGIFYFVVV